jgi:hypothetical protein
MILLKQLILIYAILILISDIYNLLDCQKRHFQKDFESLEF